MNRLLITLTLILLPLTACADEFDRRIISTNGYGEVKTEPDIAKISLLITVTRKEALAAKQEVDERFNHFLASLKKLKITEEDIIAATLRTSPRYEYNRASSQQDFVGYQASRNVTVTVNQLEQLTDVMDLALAEKIQQITQINYESSKAAEYKQQARLNAIANSKQKAAQLAAAYEAELGPIVRINYHSQDPIMHAPAKLRMAEMASDSAMGGVYLADEITFSDNIDVVFDLIIND